MKLIWEDYFIKKKRKYFWTTVQWIPYCFSLYIKQSIICIKYLFSKFHSIESYHSNNLCNDRSFPLSNEISKITIILNPYLRKKRRKVFVEERTTWKSKRQWVSRILDNRSIVQRDESVIKAPSSIRPPPSPPLT